MATYATTPIAAHFSQRDLTVPSDPMTAETCPPGGRHSYALVKECKSGTMRAKSEWIEEPQTVRLLAKECCQIFPGMGAGVPIQRQRTPQAATTCAGRRHAAATCCCVNASAEAYDPTAERHRRDVLVPHQRERAASIRHVDELPRQLLKGVRERPPASSAPATTSLSGV